MAIRATGASELHLIAAALRKEANGRQIVNDMRREIRASARPAIQREVRESALEKLPHSGGLNEWMAAAPVRLSIRTSARSAGVSVRVGRNSRGGHSDLKGLDAGTVRHPLYGNRGHWYGEAVTPGSISKAITEEGADVLEQAVQTAADRAAARILGS